MPSRDFIIRIYRRDNRRRRAIVGVVEEVGKNGRRAFTDLEELWAILSNSKRLTPRRRDAETIGLS